MINELIVPSTAELATCSEKDIQQFKQKFVLGTFSAIRALTDSHSVFAPHSLENRVITDIHGNAWCALFKRLADIEASLTDVDASTMVVIMPKTKQKNKHGADSETDRETLINTVFFRRLYMVIGGEWSTKVWRNRGQIGAEDFNESELHKLLDVTRDN